MKNPVGRPKDSGMGYDTTLFFRCMSKDRQAFERACAKRGISTADALRAAMRKISAATPLTGA